MKKKTIGNVFYNPKDSGSFGGVKRLQASLKKKKLQSKKAKEWLRSQEAYTFHKPAKKKFQRRQTVVSGIDDQFQADLVDLQKFKSDNSGYGWILTVIDVFSKYAWAVAIKNKSGSSVTEGLESVFKERVCRALQTDKGREFYNSNVKKLLELYKVHHFSTENDDIKASIVERFNQTLENKLYRWFTKSKKFTWNRVLQEFVEGYNNSIHSSIGLPPADVNKDVEEDIWLKLYSFRNIPDSQTNLRVNDTVRISKYRHIFSRGYDKNWSTETFFINEAMPTQPITFRIRDRNSEIIAGTYYKQELQKVDVTDTYEIEEILKKKKMEGKIYCFVKWKGYPVSFNSWVKQTDLKSI